MSGGEVRLKATTLVRSDIHNVSDVPRPNGSNRKRDERMSDDEFQSFVFQQASDAKTYSDTFLLSTREDATNYYKGRLPDVDKEDAEEDRSQVVITEVRDTVLGMLPDLLRIFFGSEGVVEYKPIATEDPQRFEQNAQEAKAATEFVRNIVLKTDNPDFFMTSHGVFKDALVRKTGFFGWRWQTDKKPNYHHFTGLTQELAELIAADDEIEIVDKSVQINHDQVLGPSVVYDMTVKRVTDHGRVKIFGVPCENMIVNADARSEDDAKLIGYTDDMEVGEFVALGLVDSIAELEGCDQDINDRDSPEASARRPMDGSPTLASSDPPADPTRRKIKYGEFYVRCDRDGDDIPELIKVITAGTRYKVLKDYPCDDIDFAALCPYPEAYQFFGDSVADMTMDLQRISSRIWRDMLDSLAQSVKPQTAVVEGQVNLEDVLNPDTSNVIRMRNPGMVQPLVVPFVGKEAGPVLDALRRIRETRTGMTDAAAGLDGKALQSTDNDAIQNTLTKADGRIEYIARMFIETGFKRLFRGVLRLLKQHPTPARVVELRGKPVLIDPRSWNAEMHVEPVPMLGRGGQQAQIASLMSIKAQQEQILMTLGPDNPLVTLEQYYSTIAKLVEVSGWNNVGSFFTDPASLPPEQMMQIKQAMVANMAKAAGGGQSSGPAAPDPQIEQAKIVSNERIKQAEIQQKQAEMAAEMQMRQVEIQARMETEVMKAQIARATTMDAAQLNAMVTHAGDRLAAATKIAVEKLKPKGGADNGNRSD